MDNWIWEAIFLSIPVVILVLALGRDIYETTRDDDGSWD